MKRSWIILFALLSWGVDAQDQLGLDQVVQICLEQNYDVVVARNTAEAAENSAVPGNAGLTPTIALNGSGSYSNNNTDLTFAGDIPPVSRNGAESQNLGANVGLNYILFDGLGTIYSYKQLKNSAIIADLEARYTIENILLRSGVSYYNVARLKQQYDIAMSNLDISRERLRRQEVGYDFGSSTKLNVLNAEVDYNADSVTVLQARQSWLNERRTLNQLLGFEIDTEYEVDTNVVYAPELEFDNLLNSAMQNNAFLMAAEYREQRVDFDIKRAQGQRYPRLDLNAQYGYTNSQNDAGILLQQENQGFTAGLTLRWILFDGDRISAQVKNAKLAYENSQELREKTNTGVERDVKNAWGNYQNDLTVLEIERINVATNEINFERSQEQFARGKITSTQFREAQRNLALARINLNNARYALKLSELELIRLSGRLLQ
ncbi:MAG: TolC family protein [Flavobacteriales bacterium]|nr:TolC family protein [Flavobacteriales bacterium]